MNALKRIYNLTSISNTIQIGSSVYEQNVAKYFSQKLFSSLSKQTSIKTSNGSALYSSSAINSIRNDILYINDEVRDALSTNRPVVALESAIITHGMPYPTNIETAMHLEGILRKMVSWDLNFDQRNINSSFLNAYLILTFSCGRAIECSFKF